MPVDPVRDGDDPADARADVVVEGVGHDDAGGNLVVVLVQHDASPGELAGAGLALGQAAGGLVILRN